VSVPEGDERRARDQAWLAQGRHRRLAQAFAVLAVPAAIVIAIELGNGGSRDASDGHFSSPDIPISSARARKRGYPARTLRLPPKLISTFNLTSAAKAAGCRLRRMPLEGQRTGTIDGPRHVKGRVDYKSNPPTSGEHSAVWAPDGNYAGRRSPAPENYVHSLERGRIVVHYEPGTTPRTISRLQRLMLEPTWTQASGGYVYDGAFALLLENNTAMRHAVAATAWGDLLACPRFNDRVYDAIRAFRTIYTMTAPERVGEFE
jgi:hypothetical protein